MKTYMYILPLGLNPLEVEANNLAEAKRKIRENIT